jgi:hypothetical protein
MLTIYFNKIKKNNNYAFLFQKILAQRFFSSHVILILAQLLFTHNIKGY